MTEITSRLSREQQELLAKTHSIESKVKEVCRESYCIKALVESSLLPWCMENYLPGEFHSVYGAFHDSKGHCENSSLVYRKPPKLNGLWSQRDTFRRPLKPWENSAGGGTDVFGKIYQRRMSATRYNTPVATFAFEYHTLTIPCIEGKSDNKFKNTHEAGVSVRMVPCALIKTGAEVSISWSSSRHQSGTSTILQHRLRYFPVVPQTAQIFEACQLGNIQWATTLFQRGEASPFDTDPEGWTPLHV